MKKIRKILAIFLSVLTMMSVMSAATPVFATEVTEFFETQAETSSSVFDETSDSSEVSTDVDEINSTTEISEELSTIPEETVSDTTEAVTEEIETVEQPVVSETLTEEDSVGFEETSINKALNGEVEILEEIVEWRTKTVKYFLNSDGSYTAAQYPYPVHYKKDGVWKEIDNTLTEKVSIGKSKISGSEFVALDTNTPVSFPGVFKSDGSNKISVTAEGYKISFSPKGKQEKTEDTVVEIKGMTVSETVESVDNISVADNAQATKPTEEIEKTKDKLKVENKSEKVIYRNVYENIDLEYELKNSKIKETIVLNEKQEEYKFDFSIDLGGLYPVARDNGTIELCSDSEGSNPIAVIEAPYMLDSNGEFSDAVTMEIKQSGNEYLLSITADELWLNSAKRKYPVFIDPTIDLDVGRADVIDNYVDESTPSVSYPTGYCLYAGNNSMGKARSYIKFNLPELPDENCIITNSFITFYQKSADTGSNPGFLTIHEVTENWDNKTASLKPTWNNKPSYNSVVLDYAEIEHNEGNVAHCYQFDITKTVKKWYENNQLSTNYGLLLKAKNESATNRVELFSAEEHNLEGYPEIYVTFRNNKGIENYWNYSSYSINAAGAAHINNYTGNLVYELPILSSTGEMAPLTLTAFYNNYCAGEKFVVGKDGSSRTVLAKGFRLNVQQTVLPSSEYGLSGDNAEKYPYVYTDADGTEHYLQEEEEDNKTVYKDEDGLGLTMTTDCDLVASYQITDKAHNNYYFNSEGNLGIIKDQNGNTITIYYQAASDGVREKTRIDRIVDGSGHRYTFEYYTSTTGDYVKSISDNSGRKINFITENGLLNSVTYYDETKTDIAYENQTEGIIDYIQSNNVYRLNFDYTSKANGRRIAKVKECGVTQNSEGETVVTLGQVVTFDRTKYNTTVIRSCGNDGVHYSSDNTKGDDDIITTIQFDNFGRAVSQQIQYGSGSSIGAGAVSYTNPKADDTTSGFKNRVNLSGSIGKSVENIILGGNAESTSKWANATVGTITATTGTETEQQYMGAGSLNLSVTNVGTENARCYFRQNISGLSSGKSYTLSAYVKTENLTKFSNADLTGAFIQLSAYDASGTALKTKQSTVISETTDTGVNNGWQRLTTSITIPENTETLRVYLIQRNCTGKVYYDCIQLENALRANSYNLLENSSFEKYTDSDTITSWSGVSAMYDDSDDGIVNEYRHGTNSVKMVGSPDVSKGISQTINVQGNPNDTYVLGGWAKGYPVNSTYHYTVDDKDTDDEDDDEYNENALFEIAVRVKYTKTDGNGNTSDVYQYKDSAKFNTTVTGWQYATTPIVLKYTDGESGCTYTPTKLMVMPRFNKQENYVIFDHLMLVKEPAQTYTYDKEGNLVSTSPNAEHKVNAEYTDDDDLKSFTDTLNNKTKLTYDNNHNLISSTSAKGVVTENTYNSDGLLRTTDVHNGSLFGDSDSDDYEAPTASIKVGQTYFDDDTSTAIKENAYINARYDENKKATRYTYNFNSGKVLTVTNPKNVVTSYEYGANMGKLRYITSENSRVGYIYDSSNRISYINFGKVANPETEEYKIDPGNRETYSFQYDAFGNTVATKVGSQVLSSNTYGNNNGLLVSSQYGNGNTVGYTYTNLGNKKSQSHNGTTYYYWNYRNDGTLISHLDSANNLSYNYTYDSLGRLSRQNIADYDGDTPIGYAEQGYDKRNNVNSITLNMGGRTFNQGYRYVATTYNTKSEAYGKDNLPTRYKISTGQYEYYDYDSLNRLSSETYVTTNEKYFYTNYKYKLSDRNEDGSNFYRTTQLGAEYIVNDVYKYTYDNLGNITAITKGERDVADSPEVGTKSGSEQAYRSYTYDDLGQLKTEENKPKKTTTTMYYDALGNITQKVVVEKDDSTSFTGYTLNYGYGDDNKTGWNKLLVSVTLNGTPDDDIKTGTITYDNIGNPTSYLGATLTWNGRRLKSYIDDDNTSRYMYDADGMRASKTVNGVKTTYTYLGGRLAYQTSTDGKELYFFYDSYGKLIHIKYYKNGTLYNYHVTTNSMGDVIGIYNSSGALKVSYEYDAWGNCDVEDTSTTGIGTLNPIRYRGYYFDVETGLYYLQSRYYNPQIGRFLNADSISDTGAGVLGYNTFVYCANTPVNASDPSGHSILTSILIGAVIGAVVSGISEFVCQLMSNDWNVKDVNPVQVVKATVIGGICGAVSSGIGGGVSATSMNPIVKKAVGFTIDCAMDVVQDIAFSHSINEGYSVSKGVQALVGGVISSGAGLLGSFSARTVNSRSFSKLSNGAAKRYLNSNSFGTHFTTHDVNSKAYLGSDAYNKYISRGEEFASQISSSGVTLFVDFFKEESGK